MAGIQRDKLIDERLASLRSLRVLAEDIQCVAVLFYDGLKPVSKATHGCLWCTRFRHAPIHFGDRHKCMSSQKDTVKWSRIGSDR